MDASSQSIPTYLKEEPGLSLLGPVLDVNDLDRTILDVARRARVILTLTDSKDRRGYQLSQRVALGLASVSGARILLVDRSQETWAETPHHRGPFTDQEARQFQMRHLNGFLDAAAIYGVPTAVWLPSLPLFESYDEAVSLNGVDLSVLPDRIAHPKIIERLAGECRPAEVATALVPTVPVVQVSERDIALL
jgi:hypothetical protein